MSGIPKNATPEEISQAWSLISRGKAYAVQGDPKMQAIVNALADMGVQSIESEISKRSELRRIELEKQKKQETVKSFLNKIGKRNTYDVTTQTYTDAQGNKMSVARENVPKSVRIISSDLQKVLQEPIIAKVSTTPTSSGKVSSQLQASEQKRYEKIGYSPTEAKLLAEEGTKRQMSFTLEGAKKILAEKKSQEQQLQNIQRIKSEVEKEPIGKPDVQVEKKVKVSDILKAISFGTYGEFLSRPTSMSGEEIKEMKSKEVGKAVKQSVFLGVGIGGIQYGYTSSGKLGIGTDFLTSLAYQRILSTVELRESGEITMKEQEKQIEEINKSIKSIEEAQKKLSLIAEPTEVDVKNFEGLTISELKSLRNIGVESKFTEQGEITFTSKSLEKTLSPAGIKLEKYYIGRGEKVKATGLIVGAIGREVAITFGIGYLTGGTGAIARVGALASKVPKGLNVGIKAFGIGLAGAGIGAGAYKGYQYGKIEGIGKIGAVAGAGVITGQMVGFGAGAYKGTKFYYQSLETKIISGRSTKSLTEIKGGYELEGKGGFAKQLAKYETKIKGTDIKIKTLTELKSIYGKEAGRSEVLILSKLEGKTKGLPKKILTTGETLESDKLIKARLFTKTGKGFAKQDILISRKLLDTKKIDISNKDFFKPFSSAEKIKMVSGIKSFEVSKVKSIPKDIFTKGELYLFKVSKGGQKVAGFGEFAEGKSDSLFTSKQLILKTKQAKLGKINLKGFVTTGKSRGASVELLKADLKGKLLVAELKTKKLVLLDIGKKGQVSLTPLEIEKPVTKLKTPKISADYKTSFDTRNLLKLQLERIVPRVLAEQSALITPNITSISIGAIGLKNLLKTQLKGVQELRQEKALRLKMDLRTKIIQTPKIKIAQMQIEKMVQIPKVPQLTISPTLPIITTTPMPNITAIPPLPEFNLRNILRERRKKQKKVEDYLVFSEGFTAKQLGITPKVLSLKEAKLLLSTKLTGLGIRRGIIIK